MPSNAATQQSMQEEQANQQILCIVIAVISWGWASIIAHIKFSLRTKMSIDELWAIIKSEGYQSASLYFHSHQNSELIYFIDTSAYKNKEKYCEEYFL